MWLDRVLNLGSLAHESDVLPTMLYSPAGLVSGRKVNLKFALYVLTANSDP